MSYDKARPRVTATHRWTTGALAGLATLVLLAPASRAQTAPVSGLTNPLTYACGITIGDGQVHTVSTAPVGSCFFGITTLAQLAQIPIGGTTPFSFLTDSGAETGPLATYAGTVNPFTSATGAYKLTDASVPNIDIAWLAIQAAAISGAVYLPTGNYVIGSTIPLPIMINTHFDGAYGNGDMFLGDGSQRSILLAGHSFGTLSDGLTHIPLMACGDPGATPTNQLGRWHGNNGQCNGTVQGIGLQGNAAATSTGLSSTYATDGLALGARLATVDVESNNFYHDITFVGDHTLHTRLHANGGVFGAYWPAPNQVLTGDWQFLDFAAAGQSFASLRVDGATTINGTFEGETYLNAAYYAVFGDANGCNSIIYSTKFSHLMTEFLGLALIHDEHVFNSTTGAYTDANKCRNAVGLRTDYWFNAFDNSRIPAGTNRRRRAVIDVYSLSGEIRGIDTAGGGIVPVADNIGPAGVAVFNANRYGDFTTNIGLKLSGNLLGTFTTAATAGAAGAAVPIITTQNDDGIDFSPASGVEWEDPGYASGRFALFSLQGNRTTSSTGEVLQSNYSYNQVATCCDVWNPLAGPVGISAMDNIAVGQAVPVQTAGIARVKFGWNPTQTGGITPSSGVGGPVTVVPGSGGVAGTYSFTASGGGCTVEPAGTITVANGGISSVTISAPGGGCYNPPTVTIPAKAALTGAAVTLQWPGGDARNVTTTATVPNLGEMAGVVGSNTNGTAAADVHLRGLQ